MRKALGRTGSLELWVNSPLKMDGKGLDIIWKLRHLKPNVIVVNVPVLGQSTPIFISSMLAQTSAECFAGMTIMRLLDLGGAVTYRHDSFGCYTVNMQNANVMLSGPLYLQLSILRTELAKHNGVVEPSAKALMTQAKTPGIQAALEKTAQSTVMEMAGAYCHMAAGALACDEIFSPIQLMIDSEILSWVSAAAKPVCFSQEELALDIISEVGPGGTFLDHISTAQHLREVTWRPELLSQNALSSWVAEGMPSVIEKANDKLNSLELSDEPAVSREIQKELQKIEQHFLSQT
jgi:trimethylamine---corrinoid protein Co-methyltransferase